MFLFIIWELGLVKFWECENFILFIYVFIFYLGARACQVFLGNMKTLFIYLFNYLLFGSLGLSSFGLGLVKFWELRNFY